MRLFLIAVVLTLVSCATNSRTPELESRLASWTGLSIHDLAKELGEPTTVGGDSWEWRFTGPGIQASPMVSSLSRPVGSELSSSTGQSSREGTNSMAWTQSFDTSIPHKDCAYRAKIKGVTIVEIETIVVSGRCQFSEIPTRERN